MIQPRAVLARWRRLDVTVRDLPVALLLAGASLVPLLHRYGTQLGGLPDRPVDAGVVAVLALECLPLAVRRRWPAAGLAIVSVGFAADQLLRYHTVAGTALVVALVSAGAHLDRFRITTAVLVSVAYLPLVLALDGLGGDEGASGFATFYLTLAFAWGIGAWLRSTRAAEAERHRHVAETTRAGERSRLARELHDVVTHHVTAMVVQAEAARYVTAVPERLDQALTAVSDTGRRAITDLRHVLDLLDPDHDHVPDPGRGPATGDLQALVEQVRRAGQPVELTQEGPRAEPPGSAEMATYRVVQEALTNALKHAPGRRTAVHVRHREHDIAVEVTTDGTGSRAASPGGGRGLIGLRERVTVLGGELSTGHRPGGGFVVRARIPAGGPA